MKSYFVLPNINRFSKFTAFLCSALLLFYSTHALGFKDKKDREISLEWDTTLSEHDKAVSHRAYLSQKEYYERRNINLERFIDEYNDEISTELKSEENLSVNSPERTFHLVRGKHDDRTCGFAYFKKKDEEGRRFYLEFIALYPEYQHSGIGKHLVFDIKQKWKKLKRLSLDTREFNENAQTFYSRLGFVAEKPKKEGYLHFAWEAK